jgi:CsoR family transcriptional regulator, copper-sensing transcriptional repressor
MALENVMEEQHGCCDSTAAEEKHTTRSLKEKEELLNRLKRIEGQVRGIQNMIHDERYCIDIIVQLSAINAAVKKVGFNLLETHTHHCVTDAINSNQGTEAVSELMKVIHQFTKS